MYVVIAHYNYGKVGKVADDDRHLKAIIAGLRGKHTRYSKTDRADSYAPRGYAVYRIDDAPLVDEGAF